MVCATQNPLESEGTFPLPEAQLDRFMVHVLVDYPTAEQELALLSAHHAGTLAGPWQQPAHSQKAASEEQQEPLPEVDEQMSAVLRSHVAQVEVPAVVMRLVNALVRASRKPLEEVDALRPGEEGSAGEYGVRYGAGPRGSLSLISMAKALAFLQGEAEVRWRHIRTLACPVLRHRVGLTPFYQREVGGVDGFITQHLRHLEEQNSLTKKI